MRLGHLYHVESVIGHLLGQKVQMSEQISLCCDIMADESVVSQLISGHKLDWSDLFLSDHTKKVSYNLHCHVL